MKMRKATIADLNALNRISVMSKKYWGYPEQWMEQWLDDLTLTETDLNTQGIVIMEFGSEIMGFCSIKDQGNHYEIMHLWILPDYIGKGYGKTLLNEALAAFVCKEKPIWVLADPNAESFYNKQGFVTFEKKESFPKGRFLPLMKMDSFFDQ